ncbi:MAG: hypothetical protein ABIP50_01080 [Candidatus Saccharimonadales bacterium]
MLFSTQAHAAAGTNQQLNFQGRLYNAAGNIVPDGTYNIQFKIYQDGDGLLAGNTSGSPAGTLKWTENYLNTATQGVQVINGFMSVQLGSITPFGTNVDWNQDTLWLSMNIGSTNGSCTPFSSCTPDGELLPMKRLSATPYSLNSNRLNGLTSANFVQLAQGVQTDASTSTSSVFLNKTGAGGNFMQLQSAAVDVFTLTNTGDITFGSNANHSIGLAVSAASTAGRNLSVTGGTGGSGTGSVGGNLVLQGGTAGGTNAAGGNVAIDAGAKTGSGADGAIQIGTSRASTIQIGSATLATGTQTLAIGNNNTVGSTTNITIGSGASATAGITAIQAKNGVTISTNGVVRGTFSDTTGALYLGNGVTAGAPSAFTVSGTGSSTTAVTGGALTIQGGNATVGNANGGNITLTGGTGVGSGAGGLVVFTTPTFSTTANDANCYTGGALVGASCTITAASVNNSSAILAGFNNGGLSATLPDPTILTAGRVVYITAANGSNDFTLIVNGGGTGNTIAMRQNTTATMIWNGADWTAAGASSSTTLQSAYDNTLQSAGGAELIVSKTSTTNGLTIRDSSTSPVNGTLLSVQTASAAGLFSVNSNVTEYATNAGAETIGSGGVTTFPASTWSSSSASTVSRYSTAGDFIATGQASVSTATAATANAGVKDTLSTTLNTNMNYNVSFTTRLLSGTFTDMNVYYSVDGTTASVLCATGKTATTSIWTKVNCTFAAPASGITSNNAILIRQTSGVARTFYVDNLSVTIAADFNYANDGGVNDAGNFATNWVTAGLGTVGVTRNSTDGSEASDSAQAVVTTGAANAGVRNKLAINPIVSTLYRVSVYAKLSTGTFNDFKVRYSRDGSTSAGGNYVDCVDYNTQVVTTSGWTQITCYIKTDGTTPTNPYVYFVETASAARTFSVDQFSMTLSSNTAPNVQIGGGANGGPTTLLTLDKGASAPIASDNDALLGSMYYDTTLGKLQCYEADGWGACGSSPDNIITISPEYTNAVLHGTGIGTMISDICSDTLDINDGTSGQPTICGSNETYNFYKWTSPQPTAQTYSIYVTYQLPGSFKSFASGQTSIRGRTDSINSTVQYQVYRNDATTGLTACGPAVAVSTGSVSSWQIGTANGAADPSTCGFLPGNSIVFKVNATASSNANAYIGNLNFTFSNR